MFMAVCVSVCVCVCVCDSVRICAYLHLIVSQCVSIRVNVCVYTCVCMLARVHAGDMDATESHTVSLR